MPPRIMKVIGCPGTGKTFFLLRQIEKATEKYEPSRIGAVSFTQAAIFEMRDRVSKIIGPTKAASKNIRTIHSHAFKLLQLNKSQIVDSNASHIREWNSAFPNWALPAGLNSTELEEEPILENSYSTTENRKIHQFMNILRNRCIPVSLWPKEAGGLGERAVSFWRDWSNWLSENELWDFTKILEKCKKLKLRPEIDILFADESQDMTQLQLDLTEIWSQECDVVIYSGDSDQAIFRWAGSSPEVFENLKHDWEQVLPQSYRVPQKVHEYALKLIRCLGTRRADISYLPTNVEGRMEAGRRLFPDLDREGSHMILCRCQYQIRRWQKYLTTKGLPWHNPYRDAPGWNPTNSKLWKAVQTYDEIIRGMEVYAQDVRRMISLTYVAGNLEPGIKTQVKKLLPNPYDKYDVFSLSDKGWFTPEWFKFQRPLDALFGLEGGAGDLLRVKGREIVRETPRIMLGTIHSVKGGEADHVWLDTTSSPTIARSIMDNQQAGDDETRLIYVAVTRARQSCGLLAPVGIPNNVIL